MSSAEAVISFGPMRKCYSYGTDKKYCHTSHCRLRKEFCSQ